VRLPSPPARYDESLKMAGALKYAPFGSEIELPFYTALSQLKIDHDKLDDSARTVLGLYEPRLTASPEEGCRMRVLGTALTSNE
jgi:ubiquitin-like modifier-activating enzyme ATG7